MSTEKEPLSPRELLIQQMLGTAPQQFSQPKISEDDEGDLALAIAADKRAKVVRIRFGKPIVWLGLEVEAARLFARQLLEKAAEIERGEP